ncbi:MAG: phage terminase large subunit [Christensenellaceae bacterium]|nr:phage terminase large subunit [Clostridia bacterium]MBR4079018.1 phage terminase large subunit [Christensenellaceae bacterium]
MQVSVVLGKPQPKQREFMLAKAKYVAFGGARGGGKSWSVREKAKRLALKWAGIKILIIRKTYTDLRDNHILPLKADLPDSLAPYKEADKAFCFRNGSRIKCSYFANDSDALQYQGQEYDVIFLEEATQFTEMVFNVLKACLRGANDFPKRMYLTCNPDGVGFLWVKRLFVSREYLEGENPDDFLFIQSLVDDNEILMRKNPDYVKQLDSLPEGMRERWRYGSWDVAEGQYFNEFRRDIHVCEPFPLPKEWRRYIAIDYGLDMLAAYWIAVDNSTNCYVYKEYCKPDLPISMAAKAILENTEPNENIYAVLAPPDLWNRSQETGKSKALLFSEAGLDLTKSNNDREAGWLAIKELLAQDAEGNSRLHIFKNCPQLIKNLPELLRDPKHPTDTMNEPHEITHSPDALRYFAIYWVSPSLPTQEKRVKYRKDHLEDYLNAGSEEIRKLLIKKYGGLPEL